MEPTLLQKLRDVFNTIEGWAVLGALVWLGLAKSLGWAVSFDTGAGVISPAGLLTVAAPVVLAKLGWTRPFQSVKADAVADKAMENPSKATVSLIMPILLALAVLFAVGTGARMAFADDVAMTSLSRLSAGPRVVAQVYDFDSGAPREVGFVAGAAASWNLTSRWDVDGSLERKFNAGELVPPHWRTSAGLHVLLPNSNERQQWFLAFERAWYSGENLPQTGQWVVRLQWAFGSQNASGHDYGFAIVRGRYEIPDAEHEGRRDLGIGIQPQLIGGN